MNAGIPLPAWTVILCECRHLFVVTNCGNTITLIRAMVVIVVVSVVAWFIFNFNLFLSSFYFLFFIRTILLWTVLHDLTITIPPDVVNIRRSMTDCDAATEVQTIIVPSQNFNSVTIFTIQRFISHPASFYNIYTKKIPNLVHTITCWCSCY